MKKEQLAGYFVLCLLFVLVMVGLYSNTLIDYVPGWFSTPTPRRVIRHFMFLNFFLTFVLLIATHKIPRIGAFAVVIISIAIFISHLNEIGVVPRFFWLLLPSAYGTGWLVYSFKYNVGSFRIGKKHDDDDD